MLLNKHTRKLKEYIKASNRINELYELIKDQEPNVLDKPLFVGHWRFFVVRADILRSSIGQQIQLIVNHCNTWVRGKKNPRSFQTGSYIYYTGLSQPYFESRQYLKGLTEEEFKKANFPDFYLKKWFNVYSRTKSFGSKNIIINEYYPQVPEYMLTYRYKPAYIVEVSKCEGLLESELAKLKDFMYREKGWEKLNGHKKYNDWDSRIFRKEKEKYLQDE